MRLIAGLFTGFVAAVLWLVLATWLVGAGSATGAIGLLALGFGLAFFPAIFTIGASSPRRVAQRAVVAYVLESIAIIAVAYFRMTGTLLLAPESTAWVREVERIGGQIPSVVTPLMAIGGGAAVIVLSVLFLLALRPPARPAAPPAKPAAPAAGAPPAAKPGPAPKSLPDEDAQLMSDLENLRKKLPK